MLGESGRTMISISKIDSKNLPIDISRVYSVGITMDGLVPLIFNAKRGIWGFPGGHVEKEESVEAAVRREFGEETGFTVLYCEPQYCLSSVLDEVHPQNQIIYFCRLGAQDSQERATDESVTNVRLVRTNEILNIIGNQEIWTDILNDFSEWVKYPTK